MNEITVYLAGDSTVQTYDSTQAPQAGWGLFIGEFFRSPVQFCNHSIGGRSARSFLNEGRFPPILEKIQPDDWLFVQMGHNDANKAKPERYTEPEKDFPHYLKVFLDGARQKKAHPMLITPVARLHCVDGVFQNDFPAYCEAMKRLGRAENVPVVDLMSLWLAKLQQTGEQKAREWYMVSVNGTDMTHFNEKGAREVASVLAQGVRSSGITLAQYVK